MSFWGELKRRNVYKVGVAYAIVAWLLIQAAAIVSPALQLPKWTLPFVIVIICIGFPLILLFAWAFEITPEGIKRTKEVPLTESITHLTGQKLNYIVTGLLVIAVGFILFDNYYLDRRVVEKEIASIEPEQSPAVSEVEEAPKTIAVLPFVNRSSEKDQEYFVDGLSDEIITMLSQIPDLQVTSSTSSFTFKSSDKKLQEIANDLSVAHILEGSVRKVGNALRITAQLIRAADDYHLWSKTYDRELKDIFEIQEDIATAVADELKMTLGLGKTIKQLGGTDNEKAYEFYMIAKGQYKQGPGTGTSRALESINAAIELDPKFALAWALKSNIHQGMTKIITGNQIASELDAGLHAAQQAIKLEPDLALGYHSLGVIRMEIGDWIEAELAFQKALELITDPSLRYEVVHPFLYIYVGHIKKAIEIYEGLLRNDPLNGNYRSLYMESLGLLGNIKGAEAEYEQGEVLYGDPWDQGKSSITNIRFCTGNALYTDDLPYSSPIFDAAKDYLKSPKDGLMEFRRHYNDVDVDYSSIAKWAAYFGDSELAMDAFENTLSIRTVNAYDFWWPVMKDVRKTPRFKELVKKIGLVDYWNKFGWPDMCHQLDNGDFECD